MSLQDQTSVIESYRQSFLRYGNAPEALQWSAEGQRWRFDKLIEIAANASTHNLQDARLLEIGCGLGHLYPLLRASYGDVDYTGIDIVPELIEHARSAFPKAKFECRDIFQSPLEEKFDFGFISGVFNAPYRKDSREFMIAMLKSVFAACRVGLAFNFTTSHVNFISEGTNYFDPEWVLAEVLANLSKKVILHHHYHNCDVAVYIYR